MATHEEVISAFHQAGQNKTAAAELLGIPRTTYRRLFDAATGETTAGRNYEEYRNRGTTQLPISEGLVVDAPSDFDLYLTSDWHCGAEVCDYAGLRKMIARVEADPTARMIIGGDQMEVTPPGYHDGGRTSDSDIDHQIVRTGNALQPVKDKIDLIYSGNHGGKRILPRVGIDPDLILTGMLGVNYSTVPTVVQYKTPEGVIKICGGHGKSGAKNTLLELHKLRNVYPNCDLYHLGHTHDLYGTQKGGMEYDENGDEHWSQVWFCRTGSFMRYAEYARVAMYEPMPTGYLIAEIRGGQIDAVKEVKA
jgi:hypothetical protein